MTEPARAAARIFLDAAGRVTSDRVEAEGGHRRAYAPRAGAPAASRPAPPSEATAPPRRSVAERVTRYAIRNGTGRLTGPQLSRLARDWDTGPRPGETRAAAARRVRAELNALAAAAWHEHETRRDAARS
jgi:hypothetical protein